MTAPPPTTREPPAPVTRGNAYAAIERAARDLLEVQGEGGEIPPEALEKVGQSCTPQERALLQEVFEGARSKRPGGPVTADDIRAFVETQESALQKGDWKLTDDEVAKLSKAGKLAVELARKLKGQDPIAASAPHVFQGLEPEEVMTKVRELSLEKEHLGYSMARVMLFSELDNWRGLVAGVYSGQEQKTLGIPDVNEGGFNTEHTWPKSRGVRGTDAVADLHHLYPTEPEVNRLRGSHPFGDVVEVKEEVHGSKLGLDKSGNTVFEPPDEHKGNVARALFYVAAVYDLPFPEGEQEVLARWNKLDPVDGAEFNRNDAISKRQGNRNAFIDHPHLIDMVTGHKPDVLSLGTGEIQRSGRKVDHANKPVPPATQALLDRAKGPVPDWFPKDFDIKASAEGALSLIKGQGIDEGKLGYRSAEDIVFTDLDHTVMKTDSSVLVRNQKTGALLRDPETGKLMQLPSRGFREALVEEKKAHPDIDWDDYDLDFGEMGLVRPIPHTHAIDQTVDHLLDSESNPKSREFVVTARSLPSIQAAMTEYLEKRGIHAEGLFTPNVIEQAQALGLDDDALLSPYRKAMTMAAVLHLYEEEGAPLKKVRYLDDADNNLRAAMQLLPKLFPDVEIDFYDVLHTGDDDFELTKIASSASGTGEVKSAEGKTMSEADIEAYVSEDVPLLPPSHLH